MKNETKEAISPMGELFPLVLIGHTRAGERDGGASGDSAGHRGSTFAASQRGGEPEQRQRPSVEVSIGSRNRSSGSSSKRRSRADTKIEFDRLLEGRGAARSRGRYKSEANDLFQDIQTDRSRV